MREGDVIAYESMNVTRMETQVTHRYFAVSFAEGVRGPKITVTNIVDCLYRNVEIQLQPSLSTLNLTLLPTPDASLTALPAGVLCGRPDVSRADVEVDVPATHVRVCWGQLTDHRFHRQLLPQELHINQVVHMLAGH